jgi:hypothetical protein
MTRPLRRLAMRGLDAAGVGDLVRLSRGALAELGWRRSVREGASVDADGAPLPWIAYPAIDLLARRVPRDCRVFEYGAGNSTRWWAARVDVLAAVEHDRGWFEQLQGRLPPHVRLDHVALVDGGDYGRMARTVAAALGQPWDLVVVDGRDRVHCVLESVDALSERGVIVLDNSDRPQYAPGIDHLRSRGFRQLPLRGMAPLLDDLTETSILYRPGNLLDL